MALLQIKNMSKTEVKQGKTVAIVWNGSEQMVKQLIEEGYDARLATPEELAKKLQEEAALLSALK